ncbi:DUF1778 domain-containing protein, partial [Providencia rettgeri]|uniref:type II toxin-antitoxin system TacA family antitoxin n=1 Tax=Providencia rettgeri TaxID=587 RepID=UPI001EFE0855
YIGYSIDSELMVFSISYWSVPICHYECADNRYTSSYRISIVYVYIGVIVMRNAAINLRALPEQRDLIDETASLLGKNRSDFMLEVACERAQAILLDQVFFQLDNKKFQ